MDRELSNHLVADLQDVLAGCDATTAQFIDVFFAYRLLLQRPPEFDDLDSYRIATATTNLRGLVDGIVRSTEFQRLWLRREAWAPDCVVMAEHAGLRFFFHLRDRAIGMAIATGQFEPNVERLVRSLVKPGMCCIDAGAKIGFFSILMGSLCGPTGQVYSLEPFPGAFDLLRRNIRENHLESTVVSYQLAAHERNGKATLCYRAGEGNDSFGSMFVPHENSKFRSSHAAIEIPCQRLDDLIPRETRVDLVKIDGEGSEPFVLSGMKRILQEARPILLIEVNEFFLENVGGATAEILLRILQENGYVPYDVDTFLTAGRRPYKFQKQSDRYEFRNLVCFPNCDGRDVAVPRAAGNEWGTSRWQNGLTTPPDSMPPLMQR